MAKRTYPAFLEPAEGGLGVSFPDLPGCVSFGETYEQAIANAEEALSLHLEGMAEDGESLPAASPLETRLLPLDHPGRQPLEPGHFWALVTVEAPDAAERVNVYLPKSLLERIDWFSKSAGINRSSFFGLAARQYLSNQARSAAELDTAAVQALVASILEEHEQPDPAPRILVLPTRHG